MEQHEQDAPVMVSVTVVAYNQEQYIGQTLASIVAQQTDFRFEVIVGEDCSTDGTRAVVEAYAARYPDIVRPVYQTTNQGGTQNGLACLRLARGKYLACCDGDDYWCDEHRLQYEVDYLEQHPEYIAVNSRCRVVDDAGQEIPPERIGKRVQFWASEAGEFTLADFTAWRMPGHNSALLYRNIFRQHPEDMELFPYASPIVGDRTTVFLLVLYGKIRCLDRVVSCYRFRDDAGKTNFMAVYKNQNRKDEDFLMLRHLEKWAWAHKQVRLDLSTVKKDRLAGAVVTLLRQPSRHNAAVVVRIIRYSGEPLRYCWYTFKALVLKNYWRLRGEDRLLRL